MFAGYLELNLYDGGAHVNFGRRGSELDQPAIEEARQNISEQDRKGVSILLCKRPGFVFGDGVPGKGAVPLPRPNAIEAAPVFIV